MSKDIASSTTSIEIFQNTQVSLPDDVIRALSIDNLVFGIEGNELKVLLVRQTDPLHGEKWALPGGWLKYDEDLRAAARRLLHTLTGLHDIYLEQLKCFGKVDRFPYERVITIAYCALVRIDQVEKVADRHTGEVEWLPVNELPELVYDHYEILEYGLDRLRRDAAIKPIGFELLGERFTLGQLQAVYEAILAKPLDKGNFRRKILKTGVLLECEAKQSGVCHRAAKYYRFDPDAYDTLSANSYSRFV